jgi:hypothetical protein
MNSQNWGNGEKIKGNGKIITETRTTSEYDEINVGGSFDVVLVKGKEGSIKIEGEENVIPYIEIEVNNGNLQIKYKKNTNLNPTKKMTITVPITSIDKVSLGGSGNISNVGVIKTNNFLASLGGSGNIKLQIETAIMSVSIGGSGNIEISGKTTEFNCSVAGSGNVSAFNLNSDVTNATIAGSGSAKITVNNKIKAKVVGSGNIYYKGNPAEKDVKSVGSGEIINQN